MARRVAAALVGGALVAGWLVGDRELAIACSYDGRARLTTPSGAHVPARGSLFVVADWFSTDDLTVTSESSALSWSAVPLDDGMTRIDYDAGAARAFTATLRSTGAWDYVVDPAWRAGDAPRVVQAWRDQPSVPECFTPGLNVQLDRPVGAIRSVLATDDGVITSRWIGQPGAGRDDDDRPRTVARVALAWPAVRRERIPGTAVWWYQPEPYPDATLHLRVLELDGTEADVVGAPLRFAPGLAPVRARWSEPGAVNLVEMPTSPPASTAARRAPPPGHLAALLAALLGLAAIATLVAFRLRVRPPLSPT